jgi:hypothetical protein
MITSDYHQIQADLFQTLSPRSRDILRRRFGLNNAKKETLDSIGRDLSVTRERIRQIEEVSLAKLRDVQTEAIKALRRDIKKYLDEHGGLRREDYILNDLERTEEDRPYLIFFLVLEPDFFSMHADEIVYPFWTNEKDKVDLARNIVKNLISEIEKRHQVLEEKEIFNIFSEEEKLLKSCLEVSKRIEQDIRGSYGLIDWPEVYPQRLRDKAYLVLQETGQPQHFVRVAELINEFNEQWQKNGHHNVRRALAQTVHNELIRDPRFVLVGRGLYALREWGYEEGTVKDLIIKILKESGHPLTRDDIIEKVLKQRFVEKTTVLLNLSRRDYFEREKDQTYRLVEK